jgi:hypothetical protein
MSNLNSRCPATKGLRETLLAHVENTFFAFDISSKSLVHDPPLDRDSSAFSLAITYQQLLDGFVKFDLIAQNSPDFWNTVRIFGTIFHLSREPVISSVHTQTPKMASTKNSLRRNPKCFDHLSRASIRPAWDMNRRQGHTFSGV